MVLIQKDINNMFKVGHIDKPLEYINKQTIIKKYFQRHRTKYK